jgi:transcription-repair coupling factor (superfamily II helicase)
LGIIAAFLLATWQQAGDDGLIFLDASERRAERLGAILYALDPACDPMVLPRSDAFPYDDVPVARDIEGRRASVLRRLAERSRKPLILTTPDAALQRIPPRRHWANSSLLLRVGLTISGEELREFFERAHYRFEPRVVEPGEAALQGQMIDVFPAGALAPVRIGHRNGRIESLHICDLETQRTTDEISEIVLDPATERFVAEPTEKARTGAALETLFDYVPSAVIVEDPAAEERVFARLAQARDAYESQKALAALREPGTAAEPPERLYMSARDWEARLKEQKLIRLDRGPASAENQIPKFFIDAAPVQGLRRFLSDHAADRIVLTAAEAPELKILERRFRCAGGGSVESADTWAQILQRKKGNFALRVDFDEGFKLPSLGIAVITAADVLGSRASHETPLFWAGRNRPQDASSVLRKDDVIIHLERGVGVLQGLARIPGAAGLEQEVVRIQFSGGSVMVPVEELGLIWKYSSTHSIGLDRPDGTRWESRRRELEGQLEETARELISVSKERAKIKARKLVPATKDYERFVARCPFFPTPDQLKATEDVLADLASGKAMDRLVCGDVGYGKTEIALRATAAAVLSDTQVAVIAPTTVLARQHLETFKRRFAGLSVTIGHLSRFSSAPEARAVKGGLRDGSIRVVIGTQALASKAVRFKGLGLLIIDEEQRFGAKEKAKLRGLGHKVHLLTVTATPIPRTFQSAIAGVKELSIIATPPTRRLPVRTFIRALDGEAVRTALTYERGRGGQSFIICPRIEDLAPFEERLRSLVPEMKVRILHGKMRGDDIDRVMLSFVSGDGDVLLATNIIENGLDLPRANTILIWRPDRFGLAQLHQLRGRVGRSARQGFAYLLTDPDQKPSAASEARLEALRAFAQLGAGFQISAQDLDLRGAGDLFGEEQTGHIKLVGPALYRHLLDRAVARARGEAAPDDYVPDLNLEVTGSLEATYIADEEVRLEIYQRCAMAASADEIDYLEEEIEDRFGPLPRETKTLLTLARIRQACRRCGIARIDAGPSGIAFRFRDEERAKKQLFRDKDGYRLRDDRLLIEKASTVDQRAQIVAELLAEFSALRPSALS